MSTMHDTTGLRPYVAAAYPNISGGEPRYHNEQYSKIEDAIKQLVIACKALETRLVAGGL